MGSGKNAESANLRKYDGDPLNCLHAAILRRTVNERRSAHLAGRLYKGQTRFFEIHGEAASYRK
jgi:hypothetical protein